MPADRPFALVDTGARGLVIHAANGPALAAGVRVGATLADTRAVLPALAVRPAAPDRDRAALEQLARWLGRYGPLRNVEGVDGAWVDVTGVPHLYGGEPALLRDPVARLARLGVTARAGLADTHRAAAALARFATSPARPTAFAAPGGSREALAALPVAALELAIDTVDLLRRLGLKRVGDLAGLPRQALARRFREGLAGTGARSATGSRKGRGSRSRAAREEVAATAVLMRLDQALGIMADPRRPLDEPPMAEVRLPCPEPLTTAAGIEAALDMLATRLVAGLAASDLGARDFRLALYRSDGTVAEVRTATSAPCREAAHVRGLLAGKLAVLDAGFGVDLVVLAADRLEPWAPGTPTLAGARQDRATGDAGRLVDRLAGRLGAPRVRRLVCCPSHIPERAEARVPALAVLPPPAPTLPATGPRPAILIEPPEPAEVVAEVPDGAPARLRWRRLMRRIVMAEGPERIAPEWWRALAVPADARPRTRDYWRLEDDTGAGYWVFREGLWGREDEETPRSTAEASPRPAPAGYGIPPVTAADPLSDTDRDAGSGATEGPGGATSPRWFVHGVFA